MKDLQVKHVTCRTINTRQTIYFTSFQLKSICEEKQSQMQKQQKALKNRVNRIASQQKKTKKACLEAQKSSEECLSPQSQNENFSIICNNKNNLSHLTAENKNLNFTLISKIGVVQ